MAEWDGRERRASRDDERDGRRASDFHCGQHDILWKHHDEDKSDHRKLVCGKIARVEKEVDDVQKTMTPRWVFTLALGLIAASLVGLFSLTYSGQEKILSRLSSNDVEAVISATGIKDSINTIEGMVHSINKRLKVIEKSQGIESE